MVLTSFFSGLRDLFVTPSAAFMRSPTDASRIGLGVAKGTLSLVSHSTSGFFGFASKVSANAGQVIAILSLDKDFRNWHRDNVVTEATNLNREWKRRGVQKVTAMVGRPIGDLIFGVASGVGGIFLAPVRGYRRGGSAGLFSGVALGGIGVIAKPTVGVLDALAHFSASIHDIAKSVNVLEKRYQPAIKLRLPYAFGIMNILMPFDPVFVRAVNLLKRYPLKQRRLSAKIKETLVHVEVLPNMGLDTYAIVTSMRVILIRVKKELTGALHPSFCWQVTLRSDDSISSKLSEYGHNGIALTLTVTKLEVKQRKSNQESSMRFEPEIKLDDDVDAREQTALNPVVQFDSRVSEIDEEDDTIAETQQEALVYSEATEQFETSAEEFNHGTKRGEKGQLVEWFTILAEYHGRRQLGRLHNAICCILGDFDAVIRDPSFGRPGSTEGYTSFGMFFFEPQDTGGVPLFEMSTPLDALERAHWPDSSVFEACLGKTEEEQLEYLREMRKSWTFQKELEACRQAGRPDWFATACAYAHIDQIETSRWNSGEEEKAEEVFTHSADIINQGPSHWLLTPPVTVPDGVTSPNKGNLHTPDFEHNGGIVEFDTKCKDIEGKSQPSTSRIDSLLESEVDPSRSILADRSSSDSSYMTAREFQSATSHLLESLPKTQSPVLENEQQSKRVPSSKTTLDRYIGSPSLSHTTYLEEAASSMNENRESLQTHAALEGGWTEYEIHTRYKRSVSRTEERLGRMEALMERLITFSTEQTLQRAEDLREQRPLETSSIRQEIADLRDQLQLNRNEESSHHEIHALRTEIAALREQLANMAGASQDLPLHTTVYKDDSSVDS